MGNAASGKDRGVEILSSRILVRPADFDRTIHFYRDVLGLAIYRQFGSARHPGVVFFLGQGFLEVSGSSGSSELLAAMAPAAIWLQVRDVHAEHRRLAAAGAGIIRGPVTESWGLIELWIEDPDGRQLVLAEIPPDHPLRRDTRS